MHFAAGDITDFLSIDLSTIIATWCNLLILFLVLKHFLFKPVNKVLDSRKEEVAKTYKEADDAKENAKAMEAEYSTKLAKAKEEGAQIVKEATKKAQQRSDEIIVDAKQEAKAIVDNAHDQIEREKKIAINEIKDEITDIALGAAAAVVEKEVSTKDNERLIESFIDSVGDL
ncbi:MAG: F0F1 ATP synthase subunit B [Ruminococcus sp.]|nr:F0F1 ATP synthase subunit B [Ruminococcus sp.]